MESELQRAFQLLIFHFNHSERVQNSETGWSHIQTVFERRFVGGSSSFSIVPSARRSYIYVLRGALTGICTGVIIEWGRVNHFRKKKEDVPHQS